MPVESLPATELLPILDSFDTIIDARSEAEFALDSLPGAVNWPTLRNAERHDIGTLYKQVNPFEARKRGAAIAARNIADHITREVLDRPRQWRPLTYCWRGGQRSGSLSLVLGQIGFRVTLVEGGYKAFRAAIVADTARRVPDLRFRVVCGTTGSGKTRLLHALQRQGAQVLDLEGLAVHRSSVLGAVPGQPQPSQKAFDTRIWDQLRRLDPARPVYVESESRKVGNLAVPEVLIHAMRASECLNLVLDDAERVGLLLEDYALFVSDPSLFRDRLEALVPLRGKAQVAAWQTMVQQGDFDTVVRELLARHYDPGYAASMARSFSGFDAAKLIAPEDHSTGAMARLAAKILEETP
jgi:tRNA 2-selenouridine synthase